MSARVTRAEARRRAEADRRDAPTPGQSEVSGPVDIFDSDGNHIGWCTYPRLKSSYHAKRDHLSRDRSKHKYVLPAAAKLVDADFGPVTSERTVQDIFPNLLINAKEPTVRPGGKGLISGVPIEENSIANTEFNLQQEWQGKDWKACCGYGDHNGKPIRLLLPRTESK